jgi:predicted transcriptional regulator
MSNRKMLNAAIQDTDIMSPKQKEVFQVICNSEFPVSSSVIEDKMRVTRQAVYLTLKTLLDRGFINRERGRVFLYKPNLAKQTELIKRYKHKHSLDK